MRVDTSLDALQADVIGGAGGRDALAVLADTVGRQPRHLILELLERAPRKRRWLPARAARHLGDEDVDGELLDALAEQALDYAIPYHGRRAALVSLAHHDPQRARSVAGEILLDASNGLEVRAMAGETLGRGDVDEVATVLEPVLQHESAPARRIAASVAGRRGCESLRARLELMATDDPDERVRDAARQALERVTVAAASR